MRIVVVGTGYVGLVTGACLAELGNEVVCIDNDQAKIDKLQGGTIPIHEPGLPEIVERHAATGRLQFTTSLPDAVGSADIVSSACPRPKARTVALT